MEETGMRLRPGRDRKEAEARVAETLAEIMPWFRAGDVDPEEAKGTLLELLLRPRLVREKK
jgi:hypothetical protein